MSAAGPLRAAIAEDPGGLAPARQVLLSLAEELEHARILGLRVETAICSIAVRTSIDSGIVSELQQLDAVLQRIAALRDFAAEVSRHCGEEHLVSTTSALARVTLGEVRARLAGGVNEDDPDEAWEML